VDWEKKLILWFNYWFSIQQLHGGCTSQPKLGGLEHLNSSRIDDWLSVLKTLIKQSTHRMNGFALLAKLWVELSEKLKEQRKMVVQRALMLDQDSVSKAHCYWKEAQAYHKQAE
jgi:hypothetical protein